MIWLVGAGPMAVAYAKVLQAKNKTFKVIGRGEGSALKFLEETGISVKTGGLDQWLASTPQMPSSAIVAVGVDQLAPTTTKLLEYGVKKILLEKPGGLNRHEIEGLQQESAQQFAQVYIAYNRRFYASTLAAQEIIEQDGGVTSFNFEFTEWEHVIAKTQYPAPVKEQWFLANSTHVVDMAFFIGGKPLEMTSYVLGSLPWHSAASAFSGAGISQAGALFSYQANWDAPGRWGVEVLTNAHRLYFRPMEQLAIQKKGSVAIEPVEIDDNDDKQFKPGLWKQWEAFEHEAPTASLCTLEQHCESLTWYEQIVTPSLKPSPSEAP